jgi:hypothetical protein
MIIYKLIVFLSILVSIFLIVYLNSDNKGLRRLWISFRTTIVIAGSLTSLSSEIAEATQLSGSNSQIVNERLVSNQEFNWLEQNDRQVILVRIDGNPIIAPTKGSGASAPAPKNFPVPPSSGARPNPPLFGVKPKPYQYRMPPNLVNQGFGEAGNPNRDGGGNGYPEFDDSCPDPDLQKSEPSQNNDNLNDNPESKDLSLHPTNQKEEEEEEKTFSFRS